MESRYRLELGSKSPGFDPLVRLKEKEPEGVVNALVSHIACDLTLEHGVLVAAFVADEKFLNQHVEFSFLETVEKEGVPL